MGKKVVFKIPLIGWRDLFGEEAHAEAEAAILEHANGLLRHVVQRAWPDAEVRTGTYEAVKREPPPPHTGEGSEDERDITQFRKEIIDAVRFYNQFARNE